MLKRIGPFTLVLGETTFTRGSDKTTRALGSWALRNAIADGSLDVRRLDSMQRLVAEELALEEEQRAAEKALDKRGVRRPKKAT